MIPLLSAAADYVGLRIQPGQFAGYSVSGASGGGDVHFVASAGCHEGCQADGPHGELGGSSEPCPLCYPGRCCTATCSR